MRQPQQPRERAVIRPDGPAAFGSWVARRPDHGLCASMGAALPQVLAAHRRTARLLHPPAPRGSPCVVLDPQRRGPALLHRRVRLAYLDASREFGIAGDPDLVALTALAAWQQTKGIYQFDADLARTLDSDRLLGEFLSPALALTLYLCAGNSDIVPGQTRGTACTAGRKWAGGGIPRCPDHGRARQRQPRAHRRRGVAVSPPLELMVVKYIAEVHGDWSSFRVFTTGKPDIYLFDQIDRWGCSTAGSHPLGRSPPDPRRAYERAGGGRLRQVPRGWNGSANSRGTATAGRERRDPAHQLPGGAGAEDPPHPSGPRPP
jgi:hypothetical protein